MTTSPSMRTGRARRSDGAAGDDTSYRAQLDYAGDRYGVQVGAAHVGANFNPEVGFVRRRDMRRSYGQLRFSPGRRTTSPFDGTHGMASLMHVENGAGRLETRTFESEFALEFQNNDRLFAGYIDAYEFLPVSFTIAPDITLQVKAIDVPAPCASDTTGGRSAGSPPTSCWSTDRSTVGTRPRFRLDRGRMNVTSQLSFEPRFSVDGVELLEGSFINSLFGMRGTYTATPHDVRERARAVQLGRPAGVREHASPMGVSAGQRVLHGLERTAG